MRAAAVLLLGAAVAAAPALTYADHSFGGGGHSGGGGHFSGGGGHFSGGGHSGGGGHFGGGPAGGHYGGGQAFVAPRGFSAPHYSGRYGGSSGARSYVAPHQFASGVGVVAHNAVHGATHYARAGSAYANGGWYGGHYWGGAHYWGGGYWNGIFWPQVWFSPGWAWYLPVLPLGYATFWWGGVPYYYWNDLYYAWSPRYNGYVVTDPPPAADSGGSADVDAVVQSDQSAASGGSGEVYLYPRNGQSDEQTQSDRYECHSWAVSQTGFDPTRSSEQRGNPSDYRRALIACLDARGYSAR